MGIGDTYYVKWRFEDVSLGTVYTPGVYVRQDGASFDANNLAQDAVDVWDVNQAGGLKTLYNADTQLAAILIRRVNPVEPIEQVITTGLPIAGTIVGEDVSPQNAILASWRTANIGRSYRGRTYFPAPAESVVAANGSISVADAQRVADILVDFKDAVAAVGSLLPLVVWSKVLQIATTVSSVKVDRRIRSQRKRQVESTLYVTGV